MIINTLEVIFLRDLKRLRFEIESYQNEATIWHFEKNITNSAGNLCLHLIGNLNSYIGATLGQTGYVRDREGEFSLRNFTKAELLQQIDDTSAVVRRSLGQLTEAELEQEYPFLVFAEKTSVGFFLIHLSTHLSYHLGQINYHRRLLD